jgi:hypothetical protein
MAFARLFPIDAIDAQDGDRTFSSSEGTPCGSPGPVIAGGLAIRPAPISVLKF